ncbi:HBR168Cp [Eremothecium sinecaudum]|uniref:Phosphatidylglycerol/phosphatidylinositol transfer protein n=1 Tax=Eremothecium sinecaudum TaxID=45286 RepID=A0A120K165_9SACH|nr:HBR168Cp [Eremothecium sinecaudum]AMD19069.1 HBR168Cp [Eremothecium sinecaudum]
MMKNLILLIIVSLYTIMFANGSLITDLGQVFMPINRKIPGGSPISTCDVQNDQILTMKYLHISPNPPERGANLTITASGILEEDVEEGAYVELEVHLGLIKLLSLTLDLCELLEDNKLSVSCPLEAARYKIEKVVEIPKQVPPGVYTVQARAYTEDGDEIVCLSGKTSFPPVVRRWKSIIRQIFTFQWW